MQKQVEGTPQDVRGCLLDLSAPEAFSQEWDAWAVEDLGPTFRRSLGHLKP